MESNNIYNDFFLSLSRLGNENALSDIIAATCNSSWNFKALFLNFFFPNENLISKCTSDIEREVSSEDGSMRFDLYFTTNDKQEYIIENKIYDPHDHYDEYTKIYNKNHIGFIANYNVSKIKYSHKKTWNDFYSYLIKQEDKFEENEKDLINGVAKYIKEVCGLMEDRNFYLSSTQDLGYFVKVLKKVLIKNDFEINNKAKGSNENRIGFWCIKENRSYWYGIYLTDEENDGFSIWAGIYNYKIINKTTIKQNCAEYHENDTSENCKWFKLKQTYVNDLSSQNFSYEKKFEILKKFIVEVEEVK
ncbi:hypothetical protein SAMN04487977_1055 [Treponema bryantii]|uniref:PD-(D/E)XK nuclease superfamily protein n=1 Tax=Treponema bryantii TaxID=163 RepID=A0A1H9GHQ3_9SPIR|nr:hypothetical protein [Treponema bryantii]SEQ49642.1 hypothetical protein SAMN04487977_1055 [Treponema bryantii]